MRINASYDHVGGLVIWKESNRNKEEEEDIINKFAYYDEYTQRHFDKGGFVLIDSDSSVDKIMETRYYNGAGVQSMHRCLCTY